MSHDRTDALPLAAAEPRCEPSHPGPARSRCARYMAAVPQGATMGDYSLHGACTPACDGYMDAAGLRKAVMPPLPRKVHPPMKGIR